MSSFFFANDLNVLKSDLSGLGAASWSQTPLRFMARRAKRSDPFKSFADSALKRPKFYSNFLFFRFRFSSSCLMFIRMCRSSFCCKLQNDFAGCVRVADSVACVRRPPDLSRRRKEQLEKSPDY